MKLSKSKLALAKVINENGGWHSSDVWLFSTQSGDGVLKFWASKPKALKGCVCTEWSGGCRLNFALSRVIKNWHQTIISREEYYQAYPKADDDGWIEWKGGECPVSEFEAVQVKYKIDDGSGMCGTDAGELHWLHEDVDWDIVAYRLHKPEVKPGFCESVMRSIPEPEAKPTIEQLAQDYRNAKEYAARLQKDADEAKDKSEAIKELLIKSGAEIGIVISIGKAGDEIEYKIGDKWFLVSDLKSAGWTDEQLSDYQSR